MRKIAVLNQKGGVGKTTSAVNIAAALAESGRRVAVIDMDPQAHLTIHLGVEPESVGGGAYGVLTQSSNFEQELILVRPNLWLLPANIDLVGAESELVSVVGREIILREAVESMRGRFDYLIIDCAPSLGLLTLNSLAAADEILIPLQPHFLALQGLGKLLQTVELVNKRINPALKVKWVLLCMFDTRASLPNEVKADIEAFLGAARGTDCAWSDAEVMPVHIRRNIKLAEAPSYGKTIFEYEQECNGAHDYRKVADFIMSPGKVTTDDNVLEVHDDPEDQVDDDMDDPSVDAVCESAIESEDEVQPETVPESPIEPAVTAPQVTPIEEIVESELAAVQESPVHPSEIISQPPKPPIEIKEIVDPGYSSGEPRRIESVSEYDQHPYQ